MAGPPSFLRRYMPLAIAAWLVITGGIVGVVMFMDRQPHQAAAAEVERHEASGIIRGFGPNRSYVSVAHDEIPGFMAAMTMPFEFRDPSQSAGLEVGNHVHFTFTADKQGRLVIVSIAKDR